MRLNDNIYVLNTYPTRNTFIKYKFYIVNLFPSRISNALHDNSSSRNYLSSIINFIVFEIDSI